MAAGVVVCNGFLSKKLLLFAGLLIMGLLIIGTICLTVGLAMYCSHEGYYYNHHYYYYYEECIASSLALVIYGGLTMGITFIGLIVVAVLACMVKGSTVNAAPAIVTQPNIMMTEYSHATNPGSNTSLAVNPGLPQQYPRAISPNPGLPQQHPGAVSPNPGLPQQHPGAVSGNPGLPQQYPRAVSGNPGLPQQHPRAVSGNPGLPQQYPRAVSGNPGLPQQHPRAVSAGVWRGRWEN